MVSGLQFDAVGVRFGPVNLIQGEQSTPGPVVIPRAAPPSDRPRRRAAQEDTPLPVR
jgi:hypothetical protein